MFFKRQQTFIFFTFFFYKNIKISDNLRASNSDRVEKYYFLRGRSTEEIQTNGEAKKYNLIAQVESWPTISIVFF